MTSDSIIIPSYWNHGQIGKRRDSAPFAEQPFRIEAEAKKIPNTRFVKGAPCRPFAVRDGLLISGQQGSSNARAELPSLPLRTLLVGLSSGAATAGDTALELRPGSPHWLASDPARALTAPAGQEMELIAIQFK